MQTEATAKRVPVHFLWDSEGSFSCFSLFHHVQPFCVILNKTCHIARLCHIRLLKNKAAMHVMFSFDVISQQS